MRIITRRARLLQREINSVSEHMPNRYMLIYLSRSVYRFKAFMHLLKEVTRITQNIHKNKL